MKNFKKVLSLVLALTMVLSTMTVAFAAVADTTEAKAEVLYMLRLFDGYDDDAAYTPALEDVATREQAMKLIAVAFGWEIDKDAVSDFTDVTDWAQPFVKVAFDMGVTEGYDAEAGIFGGTDPVSPRQIKTFFDRMLTGEDTWEANAALSEEPATRGEMVDAMWDALMSVKTGEVAPLIDGVITGTDAARKTAADAADMTMGEVALDSGLQVAPALTVMTISAVNKTTIKVDFDTAVDMLAVENVSVMVGETAMVVETAVLNAAGTSATITVPDLEYGDAVEITLTGLAVAGVALEDVVATVVVPALNDLYELVIDSDDADDTIKSDGATKTMLSAYLTQKADDSVVALDGVVNFSATKGGLAQTEVTLEDGVANVQLTSAASDASVVSYITVTIVDAPSATEYEGITGQFEVVFAPDAVEDSSTTFVQVQTAESNQGDRLFVTYSGDISASAYKAVIIAAATDVNAAWDTWAEAVANGQATIMIDGKAVRIDDVLQKSTKVLEFILDTDGDGADDSTDHAAVIIQQGWTASNEAFLRDNALHTLSVPANVGSLVLQNATGVKFIMTDAKKPFIYGITAANQVSFEVNFSESMAEQKIEAGRSAVNPFFLIDGKKVYLTASDTTASPGEITMAANMNYVLVRELKVGTYNSATGVDTRNVVTFRLDNSAALAAGGHVIQIANVSDWAGIVDANNVVTTQTFDFTVAADTSKPVPTLEVQSPEQWKLSFDEEVVLNGSTAAAFEIYKADSTTKLVDEIADGTAENNATNTYSGDYVVTDISSATQSIYLIEFSEDWTVDYTTSTSAVNYWTSTKNPYSLKVVADKVADLLGNKADATTLTATLPIDVTSPVILSAVDKSTIVAGQAAGKIIRVTMNEPVQIEDAAGNPSSVRMTPSEQQAVLAAHAANANLPVDVPQPTFEFVKGDKTVEGTILAIITKEDMVFEVQPKAGATLEAGTWTLYIRNLTDDVGNAYNTQAYALVVPTTTSTVTGTMVSWAAFDDGADDAVGGVTPSMYDYIYIKFTKEMDPTGAAGVSRTTNYVFNGVALPLGSQVYAGIEGVTNSWDGVTIQMPRTAFLDSQENDVANGLLEVNHTSVLNIASNFKAADGEALATPNEIELTDTGIFLPEEATRLTTAGNFEAMYINTSASNVVKSTASAAQVETLTITETAAAAGGAGNLIVKVASTLLSGGENTYTVPVADGDDPTAIATTLVGLLAADTEITNNYTIGGAAGVVTLTKTVIAANDFSLEMSVVGSDALSTALTVVGILPNPDVKFADVTSVDTTYGVVANTYGAVIDVTATDSVVANGGIDTLAVEFDKPMLFDGTATVMYAGKTFTATAGDGFKTVFFTYAADDLKTTATTGQKVTSSVGAIIVNTNKVVDKALPVIVSIKGVAFDNTDATINVTFSEPVYPNSNATMANITQADFVYADLSAGGNGALLAGQAISSTLNGLTTISIEAAINLVAGDTVDTLNVAVGVFFDADANPVVAGAQTIN